MRSNVADNILNKDLQNDSTLHVIGVVSNPAMYHSRYRLFRQWRSKFEQYPNIKLYVVEAAYGDRKFECTSGLPNELQLRTNSEIWNKENLINLGVKRLLPLNWKYLAWVDGDIEFRDHNWALETIHQLQHFPVIQPFQNAINVGPLGEVSGLLDSTGYRVQLGLNLAKFNGDPYVFGHTGYAWACTRTFYEAVGGLVDYAILGSADHNMAMAMIGVVERSVNSKSSPAFIGRLREWQYRAMRVTHGTIGYIPGRVEHYFHGKIANRFYRERWKILVDNKYNPDTDLTYDHQGVIQLVNCPKLEQEIMAYNRSRREDDTYWD